MQCCGPTDPGRRRSDNLDKEIAMWMKEYKNILKFLLLGKLLLLYVSCTFSQAVNKEVARPMKTTYCQITFRVFSPFRSLKSCDAHFVHPHSYFFQIASWKYHYAFKRSDVTRQPVFLLGLGSDSTKLSHGTDHKQRTSSSDWWNIFDFRFEVQQMIS